nr:nucleoside triphosphate pyrophosphohydrolase [Alicyclobacillus ferrooxydans]
MHSLPVIHVVGLGPGDMSSLPLGTMQQFKTGLPVFFRTFIHPVAGELLADGLSAQSFDEMYESGQSFESIYALMAEKLIAYAKEHGEIVYAVPGHPLMAEQSVQNLIKAAPAFDVDVTIGSGQSFVDAVCALIKVDPIEGLSILDGTNLESRQIHPSLHTLIVQVFDRAVASDVKLTLMEAFPDDYPCTVIRAAGVKSEERAETVPLYELDHLGWIDHLTTVYVPPTENQAVLRRDPWQLVNLVKRLREPGGCPWDQKQTHKTLRKYLIEEAYEVAEAIDNDDEFALAEELGDLLLQVLLHAQIGAEEGSFDIRDVFAALADKLIRRHPHVFGASKAQSAEEAEQYWEAAKAGETTDNPTDAVPGQRDRKASVFAKVKWAQPAVATSLDLQKAAAKVGFDWGSVTEVLAKVREETDEVAQSLATSESGETKGTETNGDIQTRPTIDSRPTDHTVEELGDLLFTIVNLARWLGTDVEEALSLANRKFSRRVLLVEKILQKNGQNFEEMSPQQLNFYWNQSKAKEKTLAFDD